MQKKLTTKDGLSRRYIVTVNEGGKPSQKIFSLFPTMSDLDIKKAVQAGVPIELFEAIHGFENDYVNLGKLRKQVGDKSKKLSTSVRSKLIAPSGKTPFASLNQATAAPGRKKKVEQDEETAK